MIMKKIAIVHALVWAALILLVSFILKESKAYNFIFLVVVVASVLHMNLISGQIKKNQDKSCWLK
jgi:hypothetical protein